MGWSLSGCAHPGFLQRTHPPVEQNENISWGCLLVGLTPDDLRPVAAPLPQQQSCWLPWFHRGVHLIRLQQNTQLTRKSAGLFRLCAKHLLPWQWLSRWMLCTSEKLNQRGDWVPTWQNFFFLKKDWMHTGFFFRTGSLFVSLGSDLGFSSPS